MRARGGLSRAAASVAMAALAALVLAGAAAADGGGEALSGLDIEAVHVVVPPAGKTGRVYLRLDNHGGRTLFLIGIRSPVAQEGALVMRHPAIGAIETDSIVVPPDETIDFATTHLRAELRGFDRKLVPGEMIPLEIVFSMATVSIDAHVHATGQAGSQPR